MCKLSVCALTVGLVGLAFVAGRTWPVDAGAVAAQPEKKPAPAGGGGPPMDPKMMAMMFWGGGSCK